MNHLIVKVTVSASVVLRNCMFPLRLNFLYQFGIDLIAELLLPNPIERNYQ